ncbi:MAG: PQQ-binding-like beta-propeller repeat protein [Thermoguttaceae bacterium]
MISPERFLALLEEKDLLSPRTVAGLREQIANSAEPITAAALAKRLIKHGRLTQSQAKRLLAEDSGASSQPAVAKPKPKRSDDLGFAPIEGEGDDERSGKARQRKQPSPQQPAAKPAAKPAARPAARAPAGSLLDEEGPRSSVVLTEPEPLGGLMADAATAGAASSSSLAAGARRSFWSLFKRKPKGPKKTEEEKWGGGLMVMGGGAFVVFMLIIGVLIYAMNYTSSDKIFNAADGDYRGGSYVQAIQKYHTFIDKFPSDDRASLARVRIGLAKLWQATPNGANWSAALQVAQEEVDKMARENSFKEAHSDLASLLTKIAESLVAEARKKPTAELVAKARQALAMAEKPEYVPKELRPESKLADARASLGIAEHDLARGNELDKALAAMQKATKELKTADAYAACGVLLHQYPDMTNDPRLKKMLLAVSGAQQALVKTVAEAKHAATDEAQTAAVRSVTLAQCDAKNKAPDADGQIALAAVDGAVYGLDAVTGRVLWRRMVGFDVNPQAAAFPPTPLSPEPGSDALVVATAHNEILRLDGGTGRVKWRYAVGEPFDSNPVVSGDKILLATRSGKLITIAAPSGESKSYVQFPQQLDVAPVVDGRRSLVYQVASHTNLFILSLDQGVCKHVGYLGHEAASITTTPVMLGDYLLIAINRGARDAVLGAYTIEPNRSDKPDPWLKLVQEIPLDGHLQMSPLVEGQRVLVTTNSGVVHVYELSATDVKNPLREVANTAIEGGGNLTRFAVMQNGRFWIADNRLTGYDVQAARGQLMPKSVDCVDSAFLQPPVAIGQAVVSVRRKVDKSGKLAMPGAIVSALSMQESNTFFWETRIASPLASEPLVMDADGKNDGKLMAVTANGGAFKIDTKQDKSAVVNDPIAVSVSDNFTFKQPFSYVARLPGGVLAIGGGKGDDHVELFEAASDAPMMRLLKVPGVLACAPAPFGRGLLAPCKAGQVCWLDCDASKSGDQLAEPFQPRIEPGAEIDWLIPAVVGDTQAVICDGKMSLYLLGVKEQPKSHLAGVGQSALPKPLGAPPVVLGQTVFAVDIAGGLGSFALPGLARGNEAALGGRCAWGPARVGDNILVSTDDGQLFCFDAKGARVWRIPLEYGPLAGAPLRLGSQLLLASRTGIVWRADAATGKELAKVDVGCPLATGPVLCGQKLLIGGHDGTLYEVRQP